MSFLGSFVQQAVKEFLDLPHDKVGYAGIKLIVLIFLFLGFLFGFGFLLRFIDLYVSILIFIWKNHWNFSGKLFCFCH